MNGPGVIPSKNLSRFPHWNADACIAVRPLDGYRLQRSWDTPTASR
jgi:hypothetical protein